MNLIVKGRGVELNDRLRTYASDKFTRAQRFFERILKMEVEFSEERNPRVKERHRVEVTVKTPGDTLRAHGAGTDYFKAIDQAAERLEVQVRKVKTRLVGRSHPRNNSGGGPLPVEETDEDGPAIILREPFETKPMTPEEAVLELEGSGRLFLVFTDADTMRLGVLYRRGDGRYVLIEPR